MVVFVERVPEEPLAARRYRGPGRSSGRRSTGSIGRPREFPVGSGPAGPFHLDRSIGAVPFGAVPKDRRMALLSRVVAAEILPRLALARWRWADREAE